MEVKNNWKTKSRIERLSTSEKRAVNSKRKNVGGKEKKENPNLKKEEKGVYFSVLVGFIRHEALRWL